MTSIQQIIRRRGGLARFRRALRAGKVVIGFMGGSITEAHREGNWPYFIANWFMRRFPDVELVWENAAIGGTGSLSGAMRARRDLIDRGCDLVFVEYAVNDGPGEESFRTREGLLRQLLAEERDVVLMHTYCQGMYEEMTAGKVPASIAELEQLAEHYKLSSVWSGLHAMNEQRAGRMSWEAWLPDGLHPEALGSSVYAEPVIELLESEAASAGGAMIPCGANRPAPLNANHFEHIGVVPWEAVRFEGPWAEMREVILPWYRMAHATAADGAKLTLEFEGRALCAMINFGKMSGVLEYSFDGGEKREFTGCRDWYVPDKHYCYPVLFGDDLGPGKHTFELTVRHGNRAECKGSNCRIFTIMAAR